MYTRELERQARSFVAQKLDRAYILHYLMETYQLDQKTADEIITKVSPPGRGGAQAGASSSTKLNAVKRSKFY